MRFLNKQIFTPLGTLEAKWSDKGLFSCEFMSDETGTNRVAENPAKSSHSLGDRLAGALADYFENGELMWQLSDLDWEGVTEFHRRVLTACFEIPSGETRTYGQLAAHAGRPNAARAVGSAMARNRWPILIPCHRVVGSNGKLTGYSGSGGISTKRMLLELETSKSHTSQLLFT